MCGKTLKLPFACFVCKPEFEQELVGRIRRPQFGLGVGDTLNLERLKAAIIRTSVIFSLASIL